MAGFHSTARRVAVITAALAAAAPAAAAEPVTGGEERFSVAIGGVLTRFDTNVRIDGTVNDGSLIDLERDGLDKETNNLVVSGTWRPGARHRISGTYFGSSRSGSRTLDQSIEVGDQLIPAGSKLDVTAKERYLFADYAYSIVKTEDVEIAGVLGLYASRFSFDLAATTTEAQPRNFSNSSSTTVPLPLIGASVDWYATPSLQLKASLTGLKAKIGDVDGSVWLLSTGAEYMFARNFGVGLSFMHTGVNVEVTKPRFRGVIDWNSNNLLFYALARF
ncbi:hypothetical protein FJQ54_02340 [Sandaracinobacter neustonicus]|uniref:Outer membrane protein beta-barrel domain-containing protein n=1 Tax=Sandaracinobacter neustonicus TaxID=1715348 RepID=A0A501XUB5_9SPHN|nr:hypothetical protein [Sandaracinobacter neustonicus]TPE63714.1 hypothetical protein FJQ54_02340 [Sandaracinobacter neustonicus]